MATRHTTRPPPGRLCTQPCHPGHGALPNTAATWGSPPVTLSTVPLSSAKPQTVMPGHQYRNTMAPSPALYLKPYSQASSSARQAGLMLPASCRHSSLQVGGLDSSPGPHAASSWSGCPKGGVGWGTGAIRWRQTPHGRRLAAAAWNSQGWPGTPRPHSSSQDIRRRWRVRCSRSKGPGQDRTPHRPSQYRDQCRLETVLFHPRAGSPGGAPRGLPADAAVGFGGRQRGRKSDHPQPPLWRKRASGGARANTRARVPAQRSTERVGAMALALLANLCRRSKSHSHATCSGVTFAEAGASCCLTGCLGACTQRPQRASRASRRIVHCTPSHGAVIQSSTPQGAYNHWFK